jgi:hypothetical protein
MTGEATHFAAVRQAKAARLARALRLCGGAAGVLAVVLPLASAAVCMLPVVSPFSPDEAGFWSAASSGDMNALTSLVYVVVPMLVGEIPLAAYLASVWFFCGYFARMVEQRLASRHSQIAQEGTQEKEGSKP